MFTKISLAVMVAFTTVPALAGGSMAPEVRVIVVQPSATIRRLNDQHNRQKEAMRTNRAAERSAIQAEKSHMKQIQAADKEYAKRLANQRKAAEKARKKK